MVMNWRYFLYMMSAGESVPVKKVAQITGTGPSAKRSASKKKGHRHMHPCSPFELEESGSELFLTT
jgi:hypothetical protein